MRAQVINMSVAPPGWESVPTAGVQAFHPEVVAHEAQHPLRGWGTDVAVVIVGHLPTRDATTLAQANQHLLATSRADPVWKGKIAELSEEHGDAEMAANEDAADRRAITRFAHAEALRPTVCVGVKLATAHLRVEEHTAGTAGMQAAWDALAAADRAVALDATAPAAHLVRMFALRMLGQQTQAGLAQQQATLPRSLLFLKKFLSK